VLALVNVLGSPAEQLADGVVYMHAGPELGVAATKSFTCSLVCKALLALALGWARGSFSEGRVRALTDEMAALPDQVRGVLADDEPYGILARDCHKATSFLCIGRGIHYPAALQGAHMLKAMSYIHAEGLPAGEVRHGARAMIDSNVPVIALAIQGPFYSQMVETIKELKAQDATVIAVATEGDRAVSDLADQTMYVPPTDPLLDPVLAVLPLQLLAYEIAVRRGCDVDQPRNLSKTIETD
jgi:glucosamine--fructose-6-phosphate aminotransferase (isomerizing)